MKMFRKGNTTKEENANSIKDGSHNQQAKTITNNNQGFLSNEELKEIFLPALKNRQGQFVDKLFESLSQKIEASFDEVLIDPLKEELYKINIHKHIFNVEEEFRNVLYKDALTKSLKEKIQNRELTSKWLVKIGEVDAEDQLLSNIWEGWLREFSSSESSKELKIVFDTMSKMNSDDAELLFYLGKRRYKNNLLDYKIKRRFNFQEEIKRLFDLKLISRDFHVRVLDVYAVMFFFIIIIFSFTYLPRLIYNIEFSDELTSIIKIFSIIIPIIVIPIKIYHKYNTGYITELGHKVLSYCKDFEEKEDALGGKVNTQTPPPPPQ